MNIRLLMYFVVFLIIFSSFAMGFEEMLFFIPKQSGFINEDGDFLAYRESFSFFVAIILTIAAIIYVSKRDDKYSKSLINLNEENRLLKIKNAKSIVKIILHKELQEDEDLYEELENIGEEMLFKINDCNGDYLQIINILESIPELSDCFDFE